MSAKSEVEDLDSEDELVQSSKTALKKNRFRVIAFRVVAYGIILMACLIAGVWGGVGAFVSNEDVATLIVDLVQEQTGAKLEIKSVEFNILTGLEMSGITLFPPKIGDIRGFIHGGEVDELPLIDIEKIKVEYSIPMFFAGRLYLKSMQVVSPQVHLRQFDEKTNHQSILLYREKHFPDAIEEAGPVEGSESTENEVSKDIVPISPSMFYMPFDILAHSVGITQLRLDIIRYEKNEIAQVVTSSGLTIDMGLSLSGSESSLWFSTKSPFESPFELELYSAKKNEKTNQLNPLERNLKVKTAIVQRFELTNFEKVKLDLGLRFAELATPEIVQNDIGVFVNVKMTLEDDLKKIKLEQIKVEIENALEYSIAGEIEIKDDSFKVFDVDLAQTLLIDLSSLQKLVNPILPALKSSGRISINSMKIEGDIDLDEIQSVLLPKPVDESLQATLTAASIVQKTPKLPFVAGRINFEKVRVEYPPVGVILNPLSGTTSISAVPSLIASGSQIDLSSDITIESVGVTHNSEVGSIVLNVEDINSKMTTRILWPELIVPILKVNVEASKVIASGDGIEPIEKPLYFDLDANLRKDLKRIGVTGNLELEDLVSVTGGVDCQNTCEKFRTNVTVRADSLENLHRMVLPLGGLVDLGMYMPSSLKGSIDFQLSSRGKIPNPLKSDIPTLLKEGSVRYNTQLNLSGLYIKIPFMSVDVENFENRFGSHGTMESQNINLSTSFNSFAAKIEEVGEFNLGRLDYDLNVTNRFKDSFNIKDVLKGSITNVEQNLYLETIDVPKFLPRPLKGLKSNVVMEQLSAKEINLKKAYLELPDLGLKVTTSSRANLTNSFAPESFRSYTKVEISHNGNERLPLGLESSGAMDFSVSAASKDMNLIAIDGNTSFKNFSFKMTDPEYKNKNIVKIESVNGSLPFGQIINLAEIMATLESSKGAEGSKVASAPIPGIAVGSDKSALTEFNDELNTYLEKNKNEYLENASVISLVDYPTVKNFYRNREPVSIKKLEVANLDVENIEFDIELKQNWFKVNQFAMEFLGGKVQGDFLLAFNPMPQKIKTSVHMTNLDTRDLIKKFPNLSDKGNSWDPFSNPYLGGTVHLDFDISSNDMAGDVEITSIGKDQLNMMLYYVDPFEKDKSISQLRTLLKIGDVRQVSIPIKNGEVGLDVDVRLLSAPLPTPKITKFPISQLIQNFRNEQTIDKEGNLEEPEPTKDGV